MVKGHNELVEAYNRNWAGFGNSIQHLDSRVGAIAMILDDLVRGGVDNISKLSALEAPSPDHPTAGGVHWPGYIKMYLKQVEEELAELKAKHASSAPQTEPFDPLITPEGETENAEDDDVVFGGKDSSDGEERTGLENRATG